ncbi:MAG: hypothetical protein C5B54_04270 [Acidobacteria bacterium]|nr:MAG: hypothetical protein C5B54_04270 [Acidobacteriota bacterium]
MGMATGIARVLASDGVVGIAAPVLDKLLARQVVVQDPDGSFSSALTRQKLEEFVADFGVCDFCSDPTPNHTILVPDFKMPGIQVRDQHVDTGTTSTGGWAACEACYLLIQQNRRADLLRRTIDSMPFGKYSAAAQKALQQEFWRQMDNMVDAAGTAKAALDFINDTIPEFKPALKAADKRAEAIRRMTGLTTDEFDALSRGDLAYKDVTSKLLAWKHKWGGSHADQRKLMEELALEQRTLPPGHIPHWQQALDRKFEVLSQLQKLIKEVDEKSTINAENLSDPKAIRTWLAESQRHQTLEHFGIREDVEHLKRAQVYSFNAETMGAILDGAQSIPAESPLSSVEVPKTIAGWFWFGANPLPISSAPVASDTTIALLWGWNDLEPPMDAGDIEEVYEQLRAEADVKQPGSVRPELVLPPGAERVSLAMMARHFLPTNPYLMRELITKAKTAAHLTEIADAVDLVIRLEVHRLIQFAIVPKGLVPEDGPQPGVFCAPPEAFTSASDAAAAKALVQYFNVSGDYNAKTGYASADVVQNTMPSGPILRFSAYVWDDKSYTPGRLMPAATWRWGWDLSLEAMLTHTRAGYRATYGPGGPLAKDPVAVGEEATMQVVEELSRFFLQSCVWMRQKVTVDVETQIERHARKRLKKAFKLTEAPTVRVIALRESERRSVEKTPCEHVPEDSSAEQSLCQHCGRILIQVKGTWVELHKKRTLHVRFVVDGHNRLQRVGPGRRERRLVWVRAHPKGNPNHPWKPKTPKVFAVIR